MRAALQLGPTLVKEEIKRASHMIAVPGTPVHARFLVVREVALSI